MSTKFNYLSAFILFAALPAAGRLQAQESKKPRIAVLPFKAGSGITADETAYITGIVRNGLINSGHFDVIGNDHLDEMIKTKKLQLALGGESDYSDDQVIDLAKAVQADQIVVGSAAGAFGEYTLHTKMLDLKTQKYTISQEIPVKRRNNIPDGARKVVKLILAKLGLDADNRASQIDRELQISFSGVVMRTAVMPGWGHIYGGRTRGWFYTALWVATGGWFAYTTVDYTIKRQDYLDTSSSFDAKYNTANDAKTMQSVASFAFLGVYVLSYLDLFLFVKNDPVFTFLNPFKGTSPEDKSRRDFFFADSAGRRVSRFSSEMHYRMGYSIRL